LKGVDLLNRLRQENNNSTELLKSRKGELAVLNSTLEKIENEIQKIEQLSETSSNHSASTQPQCKSANEAENDLRLALKKRDELKKRCQDCEAEYNKVKSDYDKKQAIYNAMLIDWEADPKTRLSILSNKSDVLKKELSIKAKDLDELKIQLNSMKANLSKNKELLKEADSKKKELSKHLNNSILDVSLKKAQLDDIRTKLISYGSDQANLRMRLGEFNADIQGMKRQIDVRSNAELNIGHSIRIMDEIRKRGVQGVHGMIIDLVKLSDKIIRAYEYLVGKKLFSIVVENEEVANTVLKINREIRGGKISVYPLTWITQQEDAVPEGEGSTGMPDPEKDECIILEQHYTICKELESNQAFVTLCKSIFKNNLLVRTLEKAQIYAKKFFCNCTTFEGEVVYSGGFLSKLGFPDFLESKLEEYLKYSNLNKELQQKRQEYLEVSKEYQNLKSSENSFTKDLAELESSREKHQKQLNSLWEDIAMYQKACIQGEKLIVDCEQKLKAEEEVYENLKKDYEGISSKLSTPNSTPGRTATQSDLEAAYKTALEVKNLLASKEVVMVDIQEQLWKVSQDVERCLLTTVYCNKIEEEKVFRNTEAKIASDVYEKNMKHIEELRRRSVRIQEKKKELSMMIEKLTAEINTQTHQIEDQSAKNQHYREELQEVNQRRFDLQIITDSLERKINQLGVDTEAEEETLWNLKKLSDKELIVKLKHAMIAKLRYTEKDKANFEKLEEYFSTMTEFSSDIKELSESKKTFTDIVKKADVIADNANQKQFNSFRRNFVQLFKKFCINGRADVEMTSVAPLNRILAGVLAEERRGIRIKCSFEGGRSGENEPVGRLEEMSKVFMSAGQRTALSLSLLLALQKTQASPIYCFDEVDADLDRECVQVFKSLLKDMVSTTQVFLTTFRDGSVPEDGNSKYFSLGIDEQGSTLIKQIAFENAAAIIAKKR